MQIVHVFPDRVTKVLPDEPLSFYVTVEAEKPPKHVEIWTDLLCQENTHEKGEYAIPLELVEEKQADDGRIYVYSRTITPDACGFFSFSVRYRSGQTWQWLGGSYSKRTEITLNVEPSWMPQTTIYNAFVRHFGARDRDGDGIIEPGEGGTFNDLIEKMDYFKQLSIGAIYLNPIQMTGEVFQYDEKIRIHYQDETNHLPIHMHPGSVYTIKEYKSIDPELGINSEDPETDQYEEFRRFVHEAHKNGIRVILDVVFDHTARDSFIQRLHPEWFLYKKDPRSLAGPYMYPDDPEAEKYWGKPEYSFAPYDHDIFWTDCAQLNWNYHFAPAENEPPMNPRIKEMREYFKSVLKYWIRNYGVDGFRLDVVYAVPTDFWREALTECREFAKKICSRHERDPHQQLVAPMSPEILFIGETYVDKVYELQECGITMLNGDFVWKLWNVQTLKGYLEYIYNISGSYFPNGSWWLHFPECHDGPRIIKKFADALHTPDADLRLGESRWTLTALLPGTPMIHNGFEVLEKENVSVRTYTGIDWDKERNIIGYIAAINQIRADHIAFQRGSYLFVESEQGTSTDAQLFSFIRDYNREIGRETCLVVVNMDINNPAKHVKIHLPSLQGLDFSQPYVLKDLLTKKEYRRSDSEVTIVLGPGESHIFLIEQ